MTDQGIIISFVNNVLIPSNPIEGDRVIYSGTISGINIVFTNGLSVVDFEYTNNDSEILADPLHRVKIGGTQEQTAINTRNFLESKGYLSASFPVLYTVYEIGGIWNVKSTFSSNDLINFNINTIAVNVAIGSFSETPTPTTAPKYFFEYINDANDLYRCEIYEKNFSGESKEIVGRATISKGEVKNHFDPIRGTSLTLDLEATKNLTFNDLYSKTETDFTVRLYRNYGLLFQGFVLPDGIYESFTSDIWNISITCTDGLGFLDNLSFTNDSGSAFSGKISMFDAIYNCLNKTGLQLGISTYIPLYIVGEVENENVDTLSLAHLNSARFIKSDNNTTMSCSEVLRSILTTLNAVITQERSTWYIFRPSELYTETRPFFKDYEIDKTYKGLGQVNLNKTLGSQVDNIYPHHCNANQKIEIKGAVSAFRLGYKYGFTSSLLQNGNLNHDAGTSVYEGWEIQSWTESKNTGYLSIDPVSTIGIRFITAINDTGETYLRRLALKSEQSDLLLKGYTFDLKSRFISYGFPVDIQVAVYLLDELNVQDYTLSQDGSWTTFERTIILRNYDAPPNANGDLVDEKFERTITISTQPLPVDGRIFIQMYVPYKNFGSPPVLVDVKSFEIINTFQGNNVIGEFHTVERLSRPSSIVKDNKTVYNGDNLNKVYTGAIYKADGETLTSLWHRRLFPGIGSQENKSLLRISAEDELRISSKPTKIFSGDFYGYMSYLSVVSINGIEGKFMPISYTFDTFRNIGSMKNLELYVAELFDIDYSKTQDFGETVKPTIVS